MKKIVISVGNPLKSDDNIGNLILDELKDCMTNIEFVKGSVNPENYIEPLKKLNPDFIFLLDVAKFNGEFGDVNVFDLDDVLNMNISTHNFPITIFRNFFPSSKIIFIGIKPKSLDFGEDLSPIIKKRFDEIVTEVKTIIQNTT
jgi:hydrogenase 3 maturation protease